MDVPRALVPAVLEDKNLRLCTIHASGVPVEIFHEAPIFGFVHYTLGLLCRGGLVRC